MAMTLRLDDEDTARLRARAEADGTSMQEVAITAIQSYLDARTRAAVVDAALADTMTRYASTISRLGE